MKLRTQTKVRAKFLKAMDLRWKSQTMTTFGELIRRAKLSELKTLKDQSAKSTTSLLTMEWVTLVKQDLSKRGKIRMQILITCHSRATLS